MTVAVVAANASDPSADGALVAWHVAGAQGVLVSRGAAPTPLPGTHPALGGARLAVLGDNAIGVQHTAGPEFSATIPAPGADALAVSAAWVAWRAREPDGDALYAAPLAGAEPRLVARAPELGRPSLDGNRLAYHVAGARGGQIVIADLAAGTSSTVRSERRALLLNPSLLGGRLVYVRALFSRQELRIGPQSKRGPRRDRRLWSTVPTGRRDAGHEPGNEHKKHGQPHKLWRRPPRGVSLTLWTTALAADAAYVTRLRQVAGHPLQTEILRVTR
jgi:hypothetical protein